MPAKHTDSSPRRPEQISNVSAMHQVCLDKLSKRQRTLHDLVGLMRQPHQREGDERHRDLDSHSVFARPDKVFDLQRLLDPTKEQLDRPTALIEAGDLLGRSRQIVGEYVQNLAVIGTSPGMTARVVAAFSWNDAPRAPPNLPRP
jgi:hypothetical protein